MEKKPFTADEMAALVEKKDFTAIEEGGKYEVKVLAGIFKKKPYTVVVRADFSLLNKSYTKLVSMDATKGTVEMDMIGAGDNLLFMGGIYGHTEAMKKPALRMRLAQDLGGWLAELMHDEGDVEKKN